LSEIEKEILDNLNFKPEEKLLNKLENEGIGSFTEIEKIIFEDLGIEEWKHPIQKAIMSSPGETKRQKDKSKLTQAYTFLKNFINNLNRVEKVFKETTDYKVYKDFVFWVDNNGEILLKYDKGNPYMRYELLDAPIPTLTMRKDLWDYVSKKYNLEFIDLKEVLYRLGLVELIKRPNFRTTTTSEKGIKNGWD